LLPHLLDSVSARGVAFHGGPSPSDGQYTTERTYGENEEKWYWIKRFSGGLVAGGLCGTLILSVCCCCCCLQYRRREAKRRRREEEECSERRNSGTRLSPPPRSRSHSRTPALSPPPRSRDSRSHSRTPLPGDPAAPAFYAGAAESKKLRTKRQRHLNAVRNNATGY